MIGYYDYTVVLTYLGMISSVIGVYFAFQGDFLAAILCLMISGICDTFDGTVARTKKRTVEEKAFGIQIDSLCDLVSFGVLPGVIGYCIAGGSTAGIVISVAFILCALIRLAYYNVQEFARQKQTDEKRVTYLGLPVTMAALLSPWVVLLYHFGLVSSPWVFLALLVVHAVLFITPFKFPKPEKLLSKIVICLIGFSELGVTIWQLLVRA